MFYVCLPLQRLRYDQKRNTKWNKWKANVVNGYDAQDRGFMVLIRAISPNDPEGYETCGGALINNRYMNLI